MSNETNNEVVADTDDLTAFEEGFFQEANHAPAQERPSDEDDTSTDEDKIENEDKSEDDKTEDDTPADETVLDDAEKTDEQDEDSDDDSEDDKDQDSDDEKKEEKPVKKSRKQTAQERINELTRARHEAERELAAVKARNAELEKGTEDSSKDDKETEDVGLPTPDTKNEDGTDKYPLGEFDPAFIRDLTRATINQEKEASRIEQEERQKTEELDRAQAKVQEVWVEEVQHASEKYDDFQDSVANLEDTFKSVDQQYSQYLADTIMSSDYGTEVLYYLSQNMDEAQAIVDAGATKATLAIGRIEANFANQSEKAPTAKKVTKAKAPPVKRSRGSNSSSGIASDTDDLDAFEKTFFK